jgi:hypothetical protein
MPILAYISSDRVVELIVGVALLLAGLVCVLAPSVLSQIVPEQNDWKSEYLARMGFGAFKRAYPRRRQMLLKLLPIAFLSLGVTFVIHALR